MILNRIVNSDGEPTVAFEGDSYILTEVKKLIQEYDIDNFVETGTNAGHTSIEMARYVKKVLTVDINQEYYDIFAEKVKKSAKIKSFFGSSEKVLKDQILPNLIGNTMFYLDAHWYQYCPLIDELGAIGDAKPECPVILIHDFRVPCAKELKLGYMHLPTGGVLDFASVENQLNRIYRNGFDYYYNELSDSKIPTGMLFVVPRLKTPEWVSI
jgi:hypothetical protein